MINFTKPTLSFKTTDNVTTQCSLNTLVQIPTKYSSYITSWIRQYNGVSCNIIHDLTKGLSIEISLNAYTTCLPTDTYNEELGKKITKVKAYKQLYTALFNLCNYICQEAATSIFSKYFEKSLDSRILTEDCIVADMYKYFKLSERERNYFKTISNI